MAGRKTDGTARPPGEPTGDLAGDELDLWRHATREARPLRRRRKTQADAPRPDEAAPRKPEPKTGSKPGSKPGARPVAAVPPKPPSPPKPPLVAGAAVGVDKRSVDRLRRGQLRPEATLDLHGMTREAAHKALQGFVARAQAAGKRCVLVITGKGTPRPSGPGGERNEGWGEERGVIRREVPKWLNDAPLRDRVLAFVEARPRHGGAGALYLLLKKRRAPSEETPGRLTDPRP